MVEAQLSCTDAPYAANGTWIVTAIAADGQAPAGYEGRASAGVDVVGGSDDVTRLIVRDVVGNTVTIDEGITVEAA